MTHELPTNSRETSGATETVRVLLVDDDEDDYFISKELLSEIEGAKFDVTWAASPDAALDLMRADAPFEVCLLDYRLGRMSGLDVLTKANDAGFRAPVILLTGQEDREVDRAAMAAGASDYLVKSRLSAAALERAIRYSRAQKDAEEALREQGEFTSAVIDTAGALIIVLDREGRIQRFNAACERATGYDASEVLGRPFWDFLITEEESPRVMETFRHLTAGHFPNANEIHWVTKIGGQVRIAFTNTALTDRFGGVTFIISMGIDVTERRRTESALAEAREREIEVGSNIQRTLLVRQRPINAPGLLIGATSIPSQEIGGDYFDFFAYDENHVDVLVGDVMGKGVPAALLAAAAKSHFQRAVRRLSHAVRPFNRLPEPEEIINAVHAELTRELYDLSTFVTLAYARFDLEKRLLTYVDCGHPRAIHVHAETGRWDTIAGDNMPLGMSERERYIQVKRPLAPGDVVFLYSDGLSEAARLSDDEQFGEERIARLVMNLRGDAPQTIAERIASAALDFSCEDEHNNAAGKASRLKVAGGANDDLTCVAVRIQPWMNAVSLWEAAAEFSSDANQLAVIRDWFTAFCCKFPANAFTGDDTCDLLTLALNEAAANIIRHAYEGRAGQRVQIHAEIFADRVRVRMWDSGRRFAPERVPPPNFSGDKDSGFGLYIIRECFDEVVHAPDDIGRNCLTLSKRFART